MTVKTSHNPLRVRRGGQNRSAHSIVRLVLFALPVFLLLWGLTGRTALVPAARAQEQGPAPTSSKATDELYDMLDDINKLNVLNPLKLTSDQIDQLSAMATASTAEYQQKLAALKASSVHNLEAEIRATKKRAVAGGEITQSFLNQITTRSDTFAQKKTDLDVQTWTAMVAKVKQILTKDQYEAAIKLIRDQAGHEPTISPRGAADKWFNVYVLQVFIQYPRIVPLLKEMRAASAVAPGANNSAANTADVGTGRQ
jgi:hypothetical protein